MTQMCTYVILLELLLVQHSPNYSQEWDQSTAHKVSLWG